MEFASCEVKMIVVHTFLGITLAAFLAQAAKDDYLDKSRCPKHLARTPYLRASSWDVCYEFHKEERPWRLASGICLRQGGRIVTIKEERIQKFLIRSLLLLRWPRRGLWIGATDQRSEMDWRWITGERVKDGYSNWASGQPSCGIICFEDCALMRWKERGRWHDYRCNWVEDYSFICEYDMLPPPTTPTTTTTTTTTTTSTTTSTTTTTPTTTTTTPTTTTTTPTTTSTSATTMKPETINVKVVKKLESDYLMHIMEARKNSTSPTIISYGGVNGARHGEVKQVGSGSTGLASGSVIGLIIGIIIGLSCGLCFVFLFLVRRRRRKQSIEKDLRVSYENPYYGEAPPQPAAAHGNNAVLSTAAKAEDKESDIGCATGGCEEDSHYVSKKFYGGSTHKERKEDTGKLKQPPPPSPLHSRPKLVMNHYDTPPTFLSHQQGSDSQNRKSSDSMGGYKRMERSRHKHRSGTKDEDNYYTEVSGGVKYTYDIPRSQPGQDYANGSAAMASDEDYNPYYNEEENMYESLEHLTTAGDEQGLMHTWRRGVTSPDEDPYVNGVRENKYVPLQTGDNIYY